ncbi:MetQ/NlpA family ABC transporter substrate-binding protein [Pseudomonas sp. S37]|uniref:MetQ/NlpA family ABC transporter substrate-binding protein n=1 Tax=Pseudomonas sp. S37 TaxID=2767449 RepID=UPI0019147A03|nr:MetQ/NlpA family ABC transporter substrate-binding protein [Pseudomonas sp. S37]MBK4992299.1 MetQ/NlpA family ABC transporter substrate-binding protein [Pseudomonas sp. S37]
MSFIKLIAYGLAVSGLLLGTAQAGEKLVIGATPVPHGEILEFIKPIVAKQGVDLDIRIFSDYIQPNAQLVSKQLGANYYQYRPFLNDYNRERGTNLVSIVPVHIEPFVAYSQKLTDVTQLEDGAKVAIPNDPVNGGRGLLLLQKLGLIKLKGKAELDSPEDPLPTQKDIVDNPRHLKIIELESAILPRALSQVELAALNGNYVLEAKLPLDKSLYIEKGQDGKNIWAEYLVTRPENKDDKAIRIVAEALNSDATREFIKARYKGAIYPAF